MMVLQTYKKQVYSSTKIWGVALGVSTVDKNLDKKIKAYMHVCIKT